MTVVLALTTGALVLGFAGTARRLLGLRLGALRTLAAGALAVAVAPATATAMAPAHRSTGDPTEPAWFMLLAVLCAVLAAMTLLVVGEALLPSGGRGGVVAWSRRTRRRRRRMMRYLQILRIAARHGLGRYLTSADGRPAVASSRTRLARAVRQACEDGGVTFVKLGQVLAARRDLVALEYAAELEQLHDQAAPAGWSEVSRLIVTELGQPIEAVFAELDPEPIAAASVAQVHAARLLSGERVVVKVQRPGIAAQVERDLDIVERLAQRLESSTRWGRSLQVGVLARGLADAVREELDFTVEARNMAAVTAQHARGPAARVRLPAPVPELSGPRVLVMEQLAGRSLASDGRPLVADGPGLAAALLEELLRQILLDGVFHADPHPGNVLLLDDGSVGLVDFGSVGRLDAGVRTGLRRFLWALDNGDPVAATDVLLELMVRPDDLEERRLQQTLGRFIARYAAGSADTRGRMFSDLLRLVAEHGLAVPPEMAAVFRALATMDTTLTRLSPGFDLVEHARRFARRDVSEATVRGLGVPALAAELTTLAPTLRRLPRRVDRALEAVEQGRLRVNIRLLGDAADRRFVTGALQQLLLVVLCATAGLMGVLLLGTQGGPAVTATVSLHHLLGYHLIAVSAILALRVLVAVFRRPNGLDPG